MVSRRQFHGLTQICHAVRAEFRPLYMQANEVCVYACESAEYAEMMLEIDAHHPADGLIAANLRVNIASKLGHDWAHQRVYKSDILDILKICYVHPSILVRFTMFLKEGMVSTPDKMYKIRTDLDRLFSMASRKWRDVIFHDLLSAKLYVHSGSRRYGKLYFHLDFKPGSLRSSVDVKGKAMKDFTNTSSTHMNMATLLQNVEDIHVDWLSFTFYGFTGDGEEIWICNQGGLGMPMQLYWVVVAHTKYEVERQGVMSDWETDLETAGLEGWRREQLRLLEETSGAATRSSVNLDCTDQISSKADMAPVAYKHKWYGWARFWYRG